MEAKAMVGSKSGGWQWGGLTTGGSMELFSVPLPPRTHGQHACNGISCQSSWRSGQWNC